MLIHNRKMFKFGFDDIRRNQLLRRLIWMSAIVFTFTENGKINLSSER